MTTEGPSRRRLLRACGAAACVLSGCTARGSDDGTRSVPVGGGCADRLRVAVTTARVEPGSVPRVDLSVENAGDAPVGYEVSVVFRQPTSLGKSVRAGRARLAGTLAPGERVAETATDEGREAENADRYEVTATASCPA